MIRLEKVTAKNGYALLALRVEEAQKDFVASNLESLAEAYITVASGGVALPFGIYDGDKPVGFLMIGYGEEDGYEGPSVAKDNYCLWRLMIDKNEQRKGYGREAVAEALRYIRTFPCGKAEKCWVSYEPENKAAAALYASFGFLPNGEVDDGETVAVLSL